MPHGGVPVLKSKKNVGTHDVRSDSSSEEEEQSMQLGILEELKCANARLDAVEGRMDNGEASKQWKWKPKEYEQSKLSRTGHKKLHHKKSVKNVSFSSESESSPESDSNVPSLSVLRSASRVQRQVDTRLKELEMLPEDAGTGQKGRVKSKCINACQPESAQKVGSIRVSIKPDMYITHIVKEEMLKLYWLVPVNSLVKYSKLPCTEILTSLVLLWLQMVSPSKGNAFPLYT